MDKDIADMPKKRGLFKKLGAVIVTMFSWLWDCVKLGVAYFLAVAGIALFLLYMAMSDAVERCPEDDTFITIIPLGATRWQLAYDCEDYSLPVKPFKEGA